jgi:hypothetical protein
MSLKKPTEDKTRDLKPFGLRMPPELKKAVEDRAPPGVSLNSAIVAELRVFPELEEDLVKANLDITRLNQRAEADRKVISAMVEERDRLLDELERVRKDLSLAEINVTTFQNAMVYADGERDRLAGELEATQTELRETKKARDDALSRSQMLEHMWDLLRRMDNHREEDRRVLEEIEEIAKFLEGDLVTLHEQLAEPNAPYITTPSPAPPKTFLAERVLGAIDGRMIRMANLVATLAKHKPLRRAYVFAHHGSLTDVQRDICHMMVDDGPGTADDFFEYVTAKIADAPDEYRETYTAALPSVMAMIFKGWSGHPTGDGFLYEPARIAAPEQPPQTPKRRSPRSKKSPAEEVTK